MACGNFVSMGWTALKLSERGIALIKRFETLRLEPYHDDAGYPTIGYGHLLSRVKRAALSQWEQITMDKALALLKRDVARSERAVARLIEVPLSQGQFDALVSFTFNLGTGALRTSTLRRVLNRGEYHEVPKQLRRWVFAGGRKLRGLVRRREAEIALGQSCSWTVPTTL